MSSSRLYRKWRFLDQLGQAQLLSNLRWTFCSTLQQWRSALSAAGECGAEKQITSCTIYSHPDGSMAVPDTNVMP